VTGGAGDGRRARALLSAVDAKVTFYDVEKSAPRSKSAGEIWRLVASRNWDLVFQEGTGIAGGANLIRAAIQRKQPYVVSSGDPIGGFFRATKGYLVGVAFEQYEKLLYRKSAGFLGWTPYLTGMALRMGAPRGATIEGAADLSIFVEHADERIRQVRTELGIPMAHTVFGVVGSLQWNPRQRYCYGLELVESIKYVERSDVTMLVVGDGSGLAELRRRVPPQLESRVVFTGTVDQARVVDLLNVMDVGLITQTLDGLGSYRLTTKLPEYLATGLPVAMSPIPGYYDYLEDAGWALPAYHPSDDRFHRAFAQWVDALDPSVIADRAGNARPIAEARFAYPKITRRFVRFINDVLAIDEAGS
jgi:hypothetical protein